MKNFMSANQRIMRDVFYCHLGVFLTPILFYLRGDFSVGELILILLISIAPTIIFGFMFFKNKVISPPNCLTPNDNLTRTYFLGSIAIITFQAVMPGEISFIWGLFFLFVMELFFDFYILILSWGVGKMESGEIKKETEI